MYIRYWVSLYIWRVFQIWCVFISMNMQHLYVHKIWSVVILVKYGVFHIYIWSVFKYMKYGVFIHTWSVFKIWSVFVHINKKSFCIYKSIDMECFKI